MLFHVKFQPAFCMISPFKKSFFSCRFKVLSLTLVSSILMSIIDVALITSILIILKSWTLLLLALFLQSLLSLLSCHAKSFKSLECDSSLLHSFACYFLHYCFFIIIIFDPNASHCTLSFYCHTCSTIIGIIALIINIVMQFLSLLLMIFSHSVSLAISIDIIDSCSTALIAIIVIWWLLFFVDDV